MVIKVLNNGSCVNREVHAQFCEGLVGKFHWSTRPDKVAEKEVAEKVLGTQDNKKSILVTELAKALDRVVDNTATDKVYGAQGSEKIAKDFLADKYPFVKIDASNLTDAVNQKAFVEKILPAKDGNKSILVQELGKFLDSADSPYGAAGNQAAKVFLGEKGLKPTASAVATELIANNKAALATEIANSLDLQKDLAENNELRDKVSEKLMGDQAFKTNIKTSANAQDKEFQKAIREVISQPIFEIPADENAPISYDFF